MEYRTQDNEMKTSGSFSYGHLSKESVGGERKKIGNHNGTNNTTQTLDYPHDFQQQQLNHGPNPDRFTQIGGKPKSKNPSNSTIKYRECLKNHAATIGGNVFDGCGEFMPSGEEGTLEALKCAACECHRNFHRKEVDGDQSHHYTSPSSRLSNLVLSPHHHHQKFPIGFHGNPNNAPVIVQPMSVAFGGGVGGGNESSSEDLNMFQSSVEAVMRSSPPFSLSKKRFRTKFTQEQKEKMLGFAEKLEWRFQKQEEEAIERFCAEVGVKRQVFKVWMHNNKSNNIKKQNDESLNQSLEHMVEPVREERLELDR